MKHLVILCFGILIFFSCKDKAKSNSEPMDDDKKEKVIQIASFKGQQVTGVTVANSGRIFVNFPRWRNGVRNAVVEIKNNEYKSFPNQSWNNWEIGDKLVDDKFIAVQSVVAHENFLYILDTRNPLFEGVLDAPRIFVFDLDTHALSKTLILDKESYHSNSYINDLRVDSKNNKIYCIDSAHAGLVIIDLKEGLTRRILNDHFSTTAEMSYLNFKGKRWNNTVHSDGIALDQDNGKLYYHALTGYKLYSIPTENLFEKTENEIENLISLEAETAAPDGMILDAYGNLYFADLENDKIQYRTQKGKIKTLVEGENVKWADTFSIHDNYLYFTNSRINEVDGDISKMTFTLNKIQLPASE
ncbi:L-dopachrome tautomerase-related protein [Cytophaga sp. FL35]|uniref:SMP-30/gluconolactonase/LRE family protein n=1 Tax=Cytophaga sp. FL35 TaxID=1904456 RepID=UPI001653819E|nr:L-dopachrome tautomerase-related protein [Cytophaga sp. FL35]MBC6999825.1 SMP-30/gluconolactonase/LRE family protein [Cytophaga sp. FL35]